MPEWMSDISAGDVVATIAGIAVLAGALKLVWRPLREVRAFLESWNGRPERRDLAGKIIDPGTPGMPATIRSLQAQVEKVRAQVENHHSSNLRDDIDDVKNSLKEHISISKEHDAAQAVTDKKLDDHIRQTESLMPMLEDLHRKWSTGKEGETA